MSIAEPSAPAGFIDVAGARIEYSDLPACDERAPPLLLLHEGLGSVSMWRDFPMRIAAATGCRTIAYSREGFGRSSRRPAPYAPRFMHDEARSVLPALRAALHIDAPVLVGHSTGASMALIHAAEPGSDIAGVVAMAPLIFVEEANLASIRAMRTIYESSALRERLARHHDDPDGVFYGWNDIWLHPGFRDWTIAPDLARIRCPLLAILGEADEYSTPAQVDALEQHARAAASFEYLRLPDCGHAPHRDQPAAVIAAIGTFVAGLHG
jgi:pimeloyl-ACP methyl ester carboxylesterase